MRSPGRSGLLLVATGWLLGACAHVEPAASTRTARHPLGSYYPLAVGNCWTYATSFQGQPQADLEVCITRQENGFYFDNHPNPSRLRFDAEGLRDGNVRYLLKAPLEEGQKWMSVADVRTVEHYEVVAVNQQVKVPAGVFRDCVEVRMEVKMVGDRSMVNTLTYAPGVGIIQIRADLLVGAKVAPQSRMSLKKFTLAGQSSPG